MGDWIFWLFVGAAALLMLQAVIVTVKGSKIINKERRAERDDEGYDPRS
jgi:hypothetical protein